MRNNSKLMFWQRDLIIRSFDIFFSSLAILCLFPLFAIISLLLLITGEHEVFYRQIRIGKNGEKFYLLKFVTMLKDSPNIGTGEITLPIDNRILPIGRFLRKTKINELPQLINVLKGEMSIIGPRPQTQKYYLAYMIDKNCLLKVCPGLSGVGSILFRNEEEILGKVEDPVMFDLKVICPYKGTLEQWFVENRSISLYFELIWLTIMVVFFPKKKKHLKLLDRLPKPPDCLYRFLK